MAATLPNTNELLEQILSRVQQLLITHDKNQDRHKSANIQTKKQKKLHAISFFFLDKFIFPDNTPIFHTYHVCCSYQTKENVNKIVQKGIHEEPL